MGLALWALLAMMSVGNALSLAVVGIALGVGVYVGAAWALGVQEVREVTLRLRRMTDNW
jgi:hypothetical protein